MYGAYFNPTYFLFALPALILGLYAQWKVRQAYSKYLRVANLSNTPGLQVAQRLLAANGIWVEPASAAGLAGLADQLRRGQLNLEGQRVVAVCTGHGLKDPEIIAQHMPAPRRLPSEVRALEDFLSEGK